MALAYTLSIDDKRWDAEVWQDDKTFFVKLGGKTHAVSLSSIDDGKLFSFLLDGGSFEIHAKPQRGAYDLLVGSEHFHVAVERGHRKTLPVQAAESAATWTVRSPMTGLVAEVLVAAGDSVQRGSVLLILESMKMRNELRAMRAGVVERVAVRAGQRVERGEALVQGQVKA